MYLQLNTQYRNCFKLKSKKNSFHVRVFPKMKLRYRGNSTKIYRSIRRKCMATKCKKETFSCIFSVWNRCIEIVFVEHIIKRMIAKKT